MPRKSKSEILADVHQTAMEQFRRIQSLVYEERKQCLEDRRFYSISGAQWEGDWAEMFKNRPKVEVNKVHLAVIRIINEYRNNPVTVDFLSKDGRDADKIADTCDGMYRADEQDSAADEAYDNAFEEAVGGGIGAWRLRADYEDDTDEDDERQRILIEPIYDADSAVFFDADSRRQDKSDADHAFVLNPMSIDAYIDEFNDDPSAWPKDIGNGEFDWSTPDVVYVAEYYVRETVQESIYIYEAIDGTRERYLESDFDADPDLERKLSAIGTDFVSKRVIKRHKVRKYLLSGGAVLEDCGYIAGDCIPIVPVYGKRWVIDGVERCMGHVRLAKDAQRIANMQRSKLAELAARSSVEKPIFTPEQMAGHQAIWANDTVEDYPYLVVNPITDMEGNKQVAGPLGYTKPPSVPPAMAALLQVTEQDMADVLGNQQSGDELLSNVSGKAVELIQTRLDMQSFIYMSNFAKAMRRSGQIWLSMSKDVYSEQGRKVKTVSYDNDVDMIELMRPVVSESGEIAYENDLSSAKLDVAVSVGPSSASRKAATVRALTGMMAISADQETQQVLQAMAMLNMEGEGVGDVRDYFRARLIKMGVVKPTEKEAKAMMDEAQNMPPDPNAQYLQAAAMESAAKAKKAEADTIKAAADAEYTNARTIETLAKIDRDERGQALEELTAIAQAMGGNDDRGV